MEFHASSDESETQTCLAAAAIRNSSLVRLAVEFRSTTHAEALTLDSYISEHHLPTARCVKIDAEGADVGVLKGATQLLPSDTDCEQPSYGWHAFNNTLAELK